MNVLAIGSKITLKKICDQIIDKVEKINLLDVTTNNFLNWEISSSNKVIHHSGDIKKIDTLIEAGLYDADIVIVHSENDMDSLFIAQKSKINSDFSVYVVVEDIELAEIFESLGLVIFDSHNLKITRLNNKLSS